MRAMHAIQCLYFMDEHGKATLVIVVDAIAVASGAVASSVDPAFSMRRRFAALGLRISAARTTKPSRT
jgi:hypothetical protein